MRASLQFTIANDSHLCKWEMPEEFTNRGKDGSKPVGQVGKITSCEMMGLTSYVLPAVFFLKLV